MHKDNPFTNARTAAPVSSLFPKRGYDPEMLYVECSRCGAPILCGSPARPRKYSRTPASRPWSSTLPASS